MFWYTFAAVSTSTYHTMASAIYARSVFYRLLYTSGIGPYLRIKDEDDLFVHVFVPSQSSVQSLYEESFLHEGRLSHAVLLLGYHPSYLNNFIKTHDLLMHGDGPLPLPLRNYLAILVC